MYTLLIHLQKNFDLEQGFLLRKKNEEKICFFSNQIDWRILLLFLIEKKKIRIIYKFESQISPILAFVKYN